MNYGIIYSIGKREIKALRVKCNNLEKGCEWEGTVGTLKEHVATCKFTLVPCPKQCKHDNNEVKHFMRKDLDKHLEKYCSTSASIVERMATSHNFMMINVRRKSFLALILNVLNS